MLIYQVFFSVIPIYAGGVILKFTAVLYSLFCLPVYMGVILQHVFSNLSRVYLPHMSGVILCYRTKGYIDVNDNNNEINQQDKYLLIERQSNGKKRKFK